MRADNISIAPDSPLAVYRVVIPDTIDWGFRSFAGLASWLEVKTNDGWLSGRPLTISKIIREDVFSP